MDNDFTLVPVELQAMMVSENQREEYAGLMMNYTITGSHHRLGPTPESHPFSTLFSEKAGIHLHWKLPDALTHGQVNENDPQSDILWPALPDRWLVTRFWRENAEDILHSRQFIVESNALNSERSAALHNENSPSWPWNALNDGEGSKSYYRYLGRSAPLDVQMDAPQHYLDKLTATGAGSPGFAAFYPFCRNVFGFHDELLDLNGAMLESAYVCYTVVGWHARPQDCGEDEPLWTGFPPPAKRLLHGMIFGLDWQANTENQQNYHISRTAVDVAVGNNSIEALSTLQAAKQAEQQTRDERWNNLLLQNNIDTLQQTNGVSDAERNLHSMGFGVWHTPPRWGLKPTGADKLPDEFYLQLDALNAQAMQLDQLEHQSAHLGQHIYECWCLLSYIAEKLSTMRGESAWHSRLDKIQQHITDALSCREQNARSLDTLEREKQEIGVNLRQLINCLQQLEAQSGTFLLQQIPDEPFYQANNPVLLFKGLERSFAHGYSGRFSSDNTLKLRKADEILLSLLIPGSDARLQASSLISRRTASPDARIPSGLIDALCAEMILLCPHLTDLLARNVQRTERSTEQLIADIRCLQLMAQSSAFLRDSTPGLEAYAGFQGVFPSMVAINVYRPYWVPLFLEWDITFFPDSNVMQSTPDLSRWRLDNLDFTWQGSAGDLKESIRLTGRMLVTPQAASVMQDIAEKLQMPNAEKYGLVDVLSQGLSDFHDQLLMRSNYVSTPVINDDAAFQALTAQVRKAVAQYVRAAPSLAGCYAPIRAGFMQINSLRVIDSFGKFLLLSPQRVYRAESLRTEDDRGAYGERIMLPPRIMQPARLKAQWTGGNKHPISGWLAYNHADKNLALYAPEGRLLGFLQQTRLSTPVVWASLPGGCRTVDELPHGLRQLGLFFCNPEHQDRLTPFLMILNAGLEYANHAGSASFLDTSTFMGRPVALASLDLWLDLACAPESPPFAELMPDILTPEVLTPGVRHDIQLQQAVFPVRLGEPVHHNDGVIGFFEQDEGGHFSTFHSASADDVSPFSSDTHVSLSPGVAEVTPASRRFLLLDPLADIHLTCGILPRHKLGLPDEAINRALEEIAYNLFASPALVTKERCNLPVPEIPGTTWLWRRPDGKTQSNDINGGLAPLGGEVQIVMDGWLSLMRARQEEVEK